MIKSAVGLIGVLKKLFNFFENGFFFGVVYYSQFNSVAKYLF